MIKHVLIGAAIVATLGAPALTPAQGTATGHARLAKMRFKPLEVEGDAPLANPFPLTTPQMIVPLGGFTSVQVNVNGTGQNVVNDAANEPSFTIDPTNPLKIAVGWRQFDNKASNFREAGNGYSTDGGASWTVPQVFENGIFRSDPVLASTAGGVFHYNSLQNSFFTDEFRSSNGGASYIKLGPATGGDKQWITIDQTSSVGSGFVYQWWSTAGNNYNGRQFSRSTDGGTTWSNPVNIPNQPVWGTLDVASNGDLWLGGSNFNGQFWAIRSTTAKNSGSTPSFGFTKAVSMGGDIAYGLPINPDGLAGQCWTAVDRSTTATAGNIYMLCSIERNASNPCDVMFIRSTDNGVTWSAPKRVNDDAQNVGNYHWFGTMSVAPNGRIDAVWNDTRNDSSDTFSELWHSYSVDGGVTWSTNVRISPAFNHFLGYPNQNKMGDYIGLISDNLGCRAVYTATFNGEQDVFYVRIIAAPFAVAPATFSIVRGFLQGGGLASLATVDTDRLVVGKGIVTNATEAPIQIVVEGTSAVAMPSGLQFTLVAQATAAGLGQKIELFNFQTMAYEQLDLRNATLTDQTVTVTPSGDASRFVEPGTMKLRTKVSYKPIAPVPTPLYSASLNQTVWQVTP